VEQFEPNLIFMNAAARFPLDLTELSVFRALKEPLGGVEQAMHFIWLLWRDLAQLTQEGGALGRMKAANVDAFLSLLVEGGKFKDKAAARAFWDQHIISPGGLGIADGDEVVFPRFVSLNPELAFKPRESRGGHGRSFSFRIKKMNATLIQGALKLPTSHFVDAEGKPLDGETVERVTRLVMTCDAALKRERPIVGWTESLVAYALVVIKKYTDDQIYWICNKVALNYGAAILNGMTTERLLPKFDTITKEIGEE